MGFSRVKVLMNIRCNNAQQNYNFTFLTLYLLLNSVYDGSLNERECFVGYE